VSSVPETESQSEGESEGRSQDRLKLGVAARMSRYLQVCTQARKQGRTTISSAEISAHAHVNPTQIRRDLSGFGRFGTRGVGYDLDGLIKEIRSILRTSGTHNIVLFGAGHLGTAIATSSIFVDHGFRVAAILDPARVGESVGDIGIHHPDDLPDIVRRENVVVGVIATPASVAQEVADVSVAAGLKILFNYTGTLLQVPQGVVVHTSNPAVDLLHALYFYLS
jgi:redox-sensing transcriptional repressor